MCRARAFCHIAAAYAQLAQTDYVCADFEKRLKAIVPSLNGAGAGGSPAPRSATAPAGSALAACAVAQAQSGSLILAATGAPAAAPMPVHSLVPLTHLSALPQAR